MASAQVVDLDEVIFTGVRTTQFNGSRSGSTNGHGRNAYPPSSTAHPPTPKPPPPTTQSLPPHSTVNLSVSFAEAPPTKVVYEKPREYEEDVLRERPVRPPMAPGKSPAPYLQEERIDPADPEIDFDPRTSDPTKRRSSVFSQSSTKQAVTLRFENVKYSVNTYRKGPGDKKKKLVVKPILRGISGEVRPGNVLAIMGSSGAGKTTLLNMLAGRLSLAGNGHSDGHILVNGKKRDHRLFSKLSAYVLQDDIFFAELTVFETIWFSARLRLPSNMPKEQRKAQVEAIIQELGLAKVRNTYVGGPMVRGVSGGERKRVNIATELITNPSLVFLDEPTSGLDAFNAQNVMDALLMLAKGGRTIITTIHQPRSEIYSQLDQLMLLSEGYCVYFGAANDAVKYFNRLSYECPIQHNPADFFLDVVSLDTRNADIDRQSRKRIQYLAECHYDLQPLPPAQTLEELEASSRSPTMQDDGRATKKFQAPWVVQFWTLCGRVGKEVVREKATNIARLMQTLIFAILLGLIWLQIGDGDAIHAASVAGILFFLLINQGFAGVFQIIFTFPVERAIITKERASRTYRVSAYFLSKSTMEMPRTLIFNTIYISILYWMVGLRATPQNFFLFLTILYLSTLAAESLAYMVSALAKTPQQAGALAPLFIILSMLFGGLFIKLNQIPVWLRWIRFLSFIKYGFSAALQCEYANRDLNTSKCAGYTGFCPHDGNAVVSFYEADELSLGANMALLIVISVFCRSVAFFLLLRGGPKFDKRI